MHRIILKIRKWRELGAFRVSTRLLIVFLMVLGLYVATSPLTGPALPKLNDKLIHFIVFFGFTMLMDAASSRKPFWLWKGAPLLLYGLFVELMQILTPYRSFEVFDLLADLAGVAGYYSLKYLLRQRDNKLYGNRG